MPGLTLLCRLVEAQTSAKTAPLVIWFSGGPGCSSLMALFTENGPFYVADDGMHLLPNNNSWNQLANVLYIESPAGTGFSYATSSHYSTNDTQTRDDAYSFLRGWLKQFPEYQGRPLYLSGESYAGHYVPQLAEILLLQPIAGVNLQGLLIGNPYTYFLSPINRR
jgi:serine carboxypeptidase-like clade 2